MPINFELLFSLFLVSHVLVVYGQDFNLTLLHTNDVHARFEETNALGGPCSSDCFGGVARRQTAIKEIRQTHQNVLLLDGGDQFQGTLWFTYYQGNATKFFMQKLGYDVMTLGNHEFDEGIPGLLNFLQGFPIPVVSSNMNSEKVPDLKPLYTASHVINVGGRNIGIIGYITEEMPELIVADGIRGLVFEDVIASVRREAEDLTSRGINIIIALGHAGYPKDIEIAEKVTQVDLVVGGHSNTFLYSGDAPSNEKPAGPYPNIVTRDDGSQAAVVQAFTQGKYLGYLNLQFDSNGALQKWNGNPILLDSSVDQDQAMLQYVQEWKKPLDKIGREVIGHTLVFLDGQRTVCRLAECNMGNMVADSLVRFCLARLPASKGWAQAGIALWNSGSIRSSFQKGDISLRGVLDVFPFRNTLDVVQLTGRTLLKALEFGVQDYDQSDPPGGFLQVSGLRVVYDLKKKAGSRVVSVEAVCSSCDVPEFSPLEPDEKYLVVTNNYMVQGGDGFTVIRDEKLQHYPLGDLLTDSIREYINTTSPLVNGKEGRITFIGENDGSSKYVCENLANANRINIILIVVQSLTMLYFVKF